MKIVQYSPGSSNNFSRVEQGQAELVSFVLNQNFYIELAGIACMSSQWSYNSNEKQYGVKLTKLKRDALEVGLGLVFRGEPGSTILQSNLDSFISAMDKDLLNQTPGRLYVDNEYLEGYFSVRESSIHKTQFRVDMSLTFLSPKPFWLQSSGVNAFHEFPIQQEETVDTYLDFDYDFNYDLTRESLGISKWDNNHYSSSDFMLTIYGPCVNPIITIENHPYKVNTTLASGERLVIDSRNSTIVKIGRNGYETNCYAYRDTNYSVFQRIPGGNNTFLWSGAFAFDIRLYLERSEPLWNLS